MADIQKLVEELSKLTVLEAVELSKALEETWGVSAAAAVAVAAAKKNRNLMLFCPMLAQTNWPLSRRSKK